MSKGLQWVIGIGVVLVVVAMIFSSLAPFLLPRLGLAAAPQLTGPMGMFGRDMPFRPGFMFGQGRIGGRLPFMGLFGLAGCIWPLLLAGLIVYAITLFGRRPAPYVAQPPLAAAPPMPAPPAPVSQAVCANCGQPLQPGWRHCPNCGTPAAQ
jgi:hypothetical protein